MTENKIGNPLAFSTAAELNTKIKEYFKFRDEQGMPYNVVGLAVFLDICKDTLNEYGKGAYDFHDPLFSATVKKAKNFIENHKWDKALKGEYNAAVAIFDLKNNHGCTDKQEISNPPNESFRTETKFTTAEEAVKAYQQACKE